MEDDHVDGVLQQALLALLDVKPKDPLRFLATHFQRECEKSNRVAQAAYLLENMNVQHPAIQERLLKAYTTISQYRVQQEVHGLTGDIYTDLLAQLAYGLPNQHKEKLLQKLQCHSTEYVSFPVFKSGVLPCLLLNEFVKQVKALYNELSLAAPGKAPKGICEAALTHLCTAFTATANDPSLMLEVGVSFGVAQLSRTLKAEATDFRSKDEYMKEEEFVSDAINMFLLQIPQVK